MKTYILRRIIPNDDGRRFCIIATADSITQLFWTTDEFDDPGQYEYKSCPGGVGIIMTYTTEEYIEVEDDSQANDILTAEAFSLLCSDSRGWKRFESLFNYTETRGELH